MGKIQYRIGIQCEERGSAGEFMRQTIRKKINKVFQMPKMQHFVINATVLHFAWLFKPEKCPKVYHPMKPACDIWKSYRSKLTL